MIRGRVAARRYRQDEGDLDLAGPERGVLLGRDGRRWRRARSGVAAREARQAHAGAGGDEAGQGGGQRGVEPRESVPQPLLQHDLPEVGTLCGQLARCDVRAVLDRPAKALQPIERGLLDLDTIRKAGRHAARLH